jgi:hypothetical protein
MTFLTTSDHPVSVAGADRAASGDPLSDTQRRVVIRIRLLERPVGVLRRRVVAVAAATVLARDTAHARAPESFAAAQRHPPTLQSKLQAAATVVSPHRRAVVFTRRSPANARPITLAVAATYRRPLPGHVGHHRPRRRVHHHDRWLQRQQSRVQPAEASTAGSHGVGRQRTEPGWRTRHASKADPSEPDACVARRQRIRLIDPVRAASPKHSGHPWRSHRPARSQRAMIASDRITPTSLASATPARLPD